MNYVYHILRLLVLLQSSDFGSDVRLLATSLDDEVRWVWASWIGSAPSWLAVMCQANWPGFAVSFGIEDRCDDKV